MRDFPAILALPGAPTRANTANVLRFIGQALPQQAVIVESSSFRLDRIDLYLSDAGRRHTFERASVALRSCSGRSLAGGLSPGRDPRAR